MQNVDGKVFRVTVVCVLIVATVLLVRAYDRHHRHSIKLDDIGFVGKAYAFSGLHPTRCEEGHPDTNPPEVRDWFERLKNRAGGGCCSEGDGYPAIVDEEASPGKLGRGHIIDPSEKEIWARGCLVKKRPALAPPYEFKFTYDKTVHEKHGNPNKTAYVFGGILWEAGAKKPVFTKDPYCVVMLPPSF